MPRMPADFRISLKKRGGPTHRIELVRQSTGRARFVVRKDGRISEELPEASATEIADRLRRWLAGDEFA